MVIQQNADVPVWGQADPGESIKVELSGRYAVTTGPKKGTTLSYKRISQVTAGKDGKWTIRMRTAAAGGPLKLQIQCEKNRIDIEDVMVGEVWICSGQSNMAMTVSRSLNAEQETESANHPGIRMFTTARQASVKPQENCKGDWKVCSPQTVSAFSATAYFFGRQLHAELGVPIGLINSSWGGTAVEAWTSMPAQKNIAKLEPVFAPWKSGDDPARYKAAMDRYQKALDAWKKKATDAKKAKKKAPRKPRAPVKMSENQNYPANLFNGMINPMIPYRIRGAIWYQGERNSNKGEISVLYGLQLTTLIKDWRTRWDQGAFPFLFVQLPNFKVVQTQPVEESGWSNVREGMQETLAIENTGMAITLDAGDANDIHPKNKQVVGSRLARWALATSYGKKGIVYSGPIYKSMEKRGDSIVVHFDHAEGLRAKGGELQGFAIRGKDGEYVWADARVEGETVVVSSAKVKKPVAVRYAWAMNPIGNLLNAAKIPASPFRTDR